MWTQIFLEFLSVCVFVWLIVFQTSHEWPWVGLYPEQLRHALNLDVDDVIHTHNSTSIKHKTCFTTLYIKLSHYSKTTLYIRLSHYGKIGLQHYFDKNYQTYVFDRNIRPMCFDLEALVSLSLLSLLGMINFFSPLT